ncbi:MAG: M48 family metallopeptidase [Hyphomicrobium sp.]
MSMRSEFDDLTGPVFEGRYSDGKSAAGRDIRVRLTDRGIALETPDGAPLIWPYGALAVAEPLTQHSIDALITYSYAPGATLFVPEGTFARRLANNAPQLTARAQRMSHARPWIWAAVGVIALTGLVWLSGLSPSRSVATMLPDGVRARLGEQVVTSLTSSHKLCTDPAGRRALDKLVTRLSTSANHGKPFKVVVVDWDLLNAFATPGEQIILTRGLLNKAEGPDEVAGVVGHEMGHGIELHPETGIVRAIGISAAIELMVGGGGGTIASIGSALAQLSYTRKAEREADDHALAILKNAGISAQGFADFFKRLGDLEGKMPGSKTLGGVDILRSHPQSEERRRHASSQPDYPSTPSLTAAEWQALKMICGKPTADDGKPDPGK